MWESSPEAIGRSMCGCSFTLLSASEERRIAGFKPLYNVFPTGIAVSPTLPVAFLFYRTEDVCILIIVEDTFLPYIEVPAVELKPIFLDCLLYERISAETF